ncbi:glycoside hydrolase family 55 protein [Rubinisphaera sp. JC750]|uniref:glycoside hydrolase family 55 protein n=1 Tax=Rubinisphaera sp. JC750 TaxID=2898658 RepID=UPI001F37AE87|nr:glycoside hydrolase family 55 protein [Rubinisphaera sp. JC750]
MVRLRLLVILFCLLLPCFVTAPVAAQTKLWGRTGEAWDPAGLLPDFSQAGYQRGERAIPERKPTVSLTKYGIKANTDITEALQRAIDENPGACIGIPAGKYNVTERIKVESAGTVIQGASVRSTTLYFPKSLYEIDPQETENGGGMKTTPYSWSGGFLVIGSYNADSGPRLPVTSESKRGDYTLQLESTDGLSTGDEVQLELADDDAGSLTNYLYRDEPGDAATIIGKVKLQLHARVVAVDGQQVTLDRPLRTDLQPDWKPTLRKFQFKTQECGLENMTLEFPVTPYGGHFLEMGYNGIDLRGMHNWVRNVEILNCDSGIFMHGVFNTLEDITIRSERETDSKGNTGHHGLTTSGEDCLVTGFNVRTKFVHDLTFGAAATGNVYSAGRGIDLCFDFHRYAPYENLLTDIDLGRGTRPWASGGTQGKGRHTAAGATFWNIESDTPLTPPKEDFACPEIIFVGLSTRDAGNGQVLTLPGGWYYESHRPGRFQPRNLHEAQKKRRLQNASPARAQR